MPAAPPPRRPRPGPGLRPAAPAEPAPPAARRPGAHRASRPHPPVAPAPAPAPTAPPAAAPAPAAASAAGSAPAVRPAGPPALPARGLVVVGGERIRVPGIAALFRRHPRLTRGTGLGAVATGVALFVAASLTTPLAGADTAKPPARPSTSARPPAPVVDTPAAGLAGPATRKRLPAAPVHAAKKAPVGHISGLAANGIPEVALNAYRVAAARMGNAAPSCGIDWALLAGIGREESDHGRFGGAVLHADGVSTPRIIGPALDGVHWDYIPAPADGARLYGDGRYAHALGPMQFIPSTWALYGTDANGDGRADVFNINDAALGAARYLCAAGGNLRGRAGQERAVLAYNHNDQYLAQVLALADAYRTGVPVTGIPVGITSGALPTVTDTGYLPPANPAAPTAAGRGGNGSGGSGGGAHAGRAKAHRPGAGTSRSSSAPHSAPAGGRSGSTPAPAPGTTAPRPGGSSSTPAPAPSSPSPSPTRTCNILQLLCKP